MNPKPAPSVAGKTESERFDNALRTVFSVPKSEIERREAEWQQERGKQDKVSSNGKRPLK
jgi:hypothetical protein